ncbi:MAG: hypothetical protein KBS59_05960 [Clostridiales bacterium]|nr:hypothetical protein [Clostridiales bacterium]
MSKIKDFKDNIVRKWKDITPAEKKNAWENIRMILILLCLAAPFIFLVVMCLSYFV